MMYGKIKKIQYNDVETLLGGIMRTSVTKKGGGDAD